MPLLARGPGFGIKKDISSVIRTPDFYISLFFPVDTHEKGLVFKKLIQCEFRLSSFLYFHILTIPFI